MTEFEHQRHKAPAPLSRPRELVIACAPLRSNVNLSRIVRAAACCAAERVLCSGPAKVLRKIARDGAETIQLEQHRTLPPVLRTLREAGYEIVGLEQTSGSENLHELEFKRRTVLVVGNERRGLTEDELAEVDRVAEIPVWGLPYSYNVATAASMAMYEYCRQFPVG